MRRLAAVAPILAVLALAGCGGHTTTVKRTVTQPVQVIGGHHCTPADEAMQCVLRPPPSLLKLQGLVPFELQGIDFAWTKFSPAAAGSFGASYISACDPSKDWSRSLVDAYHTAHKGTVAVFECAATRALDGCAAGRADATSGEQYLASLGFPRSHEDLAIDFDATGPDVLAYFRCANDAEPGLIGAYGGAGPVSYLCAQHVTTRSWATYAWLYRTNGVWPPPACAPLQQYLNGSTADHDHALAPDYGQFPSPSVVVRVNHHYGRYPATRRKLCHGCSERGVVRRYDRLRAQQRPNRHPHRAELRRLRHDAGLLADRIDHVAHRTKHGYRAFHRVERRDGLRAREHGGVVPRRRQAHR